MPYPYQSRNCDSGKLHCYGYNCRSLRMHHHNPRKNYHLTHTAFDYWIANLVIKFIFTLTYFMFVLVMLRLACSCSRFANFIMPNMAKNKIPLLNWLNAKRLRKAKPERHIILTHLVPLSRLLDSRYRRRMSR